jgi:catechol 2,3-dioxygenase-like lactoylglutathione lyase family enzyme
LGVAVLQQVKVDSGAGPATFTFFDTEPKGKYVLGLVYWPGGMPETSGGLHVTHLAFAARELESVSAFWEKLGFPAVRAVHAAPREDSRYHGAPLWLNFDVGWDGHTKPGAEWIVPPRTPSNCYDDFLKAHGEGVHHFGAPVDDLEKTTAEYRTLGYSVLQAGAWGEVGRKDSGQYHYMDTDSIGGVVVELIRAYK